ncbi:MAG: LysE family transporter [Niabella sp.]
MTEALIKGLTLGLLLSIAVGPVLFSILKLSINEGHKGGIAFVLGVSLSDISLAFVSNVFSEFFNVISSHKGYISVIGSSFLIIFGIYYLFVKKIKVNVDGKIVSNLLRKRDYAKLLLSGYFMNTLNPAVILFWLTVSTSSLTHTIKERIVIFATCLLLVLSADICKVMLANKIRNKMTPHNIHILNRVNGGILICFGVALIVRLFVKIG